MDHNVAIKLKELEKRIEKVSAPKEIMTFEEATKQYGWSRRKIYRLRSEGVLSFYRFPNTRRRYLKRSEIEQLFEVDKLEAA